MEFAISFIGGYSNTILPEGFDVFPEWLSVFPEPYRDCYLQTPYELSQGTSLCFS